MIQSLEELSTLPTLVKKSSSHDWNRKGKLFFERRQYELVKIILFIIFIVKCNSSLFLTNVMKIIFKAKLCFSRSGNEAGLKLANAYNLQKIARTSLANNSYEAKSNFISAAQAFETCSRPVQAASCYKVCFLDII